MLTCSNDLLLFFFNFVEVSYKGGEKPPEATYILISRRYPNRPRCIHIADKEQGLGIIRSRHASIDNMCPYPITRFRTEPSGSGWVPNIITSIPSPLLPRSAHCHYRHHYHYPSEPTPDLPHYWPAVSGERKMPCMFTIG